MLNFVWTFAPDTSSFNGTCGTGSSNTNSGAWTGTKHVGQLTMVLTPTESRLKLGASQPFSVMLAGTPDKRLSWSVVDGAGSIDGNGIFTAGSAPGGVSHVLVQSVVDSSVSQGATLSASWDGNLDISGSYTENFGTTLTLYQNGASIYGVRASDGLILQGVLVGRQLVGIWTSGNGSNYGDLSWTFAPDGMSYSGLFSENKETVLGRSWSGARQAGVVSVLMRPSVSVLPPSWSQNFTAQVAGSYDKRVSWTVQETGGGSVNTGGVYTAPAAAGTYHLVAAALVAPSATATAAIEVRVNDLQVAPSSIALRAAATAKFQATIQGTPATAVTWSVQEAGGGSISSAGLYTAPLTAGVYHVQATSTVDGTQTAVAEISVRSDAALSVSISPDTTTLGLGGTSSFAATVDGSSYQAVTWTTTGGTIDSTGHYTAPNAYGTYTITATSIDDPTASDTATVVVSSGLATDKTFTYDLNGNLIDDGTRQFKYDAENRLIAVVQNNHQSNFVYDGAGHRVEIVEKDQDAQLHWSVSNDTKYVYEGTTALESLAADGSTVLQRYYGQGFIDTDGLALFCAQDQLNSVRELVDATGTVRARYDYDPWGRTTKLSGDRESPFLYTGHFWHAQSGLYLTFFRAYDPNLGRWTSQDPSGEYSDSNLYAYVNNAPVGFMDPSGLAPEWCPFYNEPWFQSIGDSLNSMGGFWGDVLTGHATENAQQRYDTGPLGQAQRLTNPCSNDPLDRFAYNQTEAWLALADSLKHYTVGAFVFHGGEGDAFEGGFFTGMIHEYDSEHGYSQGNLTEAWLGGEGGAVGGGKITGTYPSTDGLKDGYFGFTGVGVSAGPLAGTQLGIAGSPQWGAIYWEGHFGSAAIGVGIYANPRGY